MITSTLSEKANLGNNTYDLDKRVEALETAYAQSSELITSKEVQAGNIKATNADLTNITSSKIGATVVEADIGRFENLTSEGLAVFKDISVENITIKNNNAATFKSVEIEDLKATNATITNLELLNPNLDKLNLNDLVSSNAKFDYVEAGSAVVTGELDSANIDVRGTNTPRLTFGDKAVIEYNTILDAMSMDARNALAIQSVARPTWNEKTMATLEDVTSGIDIIAAVDTVGDLPDVAGLPNGTAYFVRNIESEGGASGTAIAINNVWEITPYYGLTEYRTALAQDQIDNAQNATIIQETTERKNADIALQDNIDTLDATVADNKAAQDLVNTTIDNHLDVLDVGVAENKAAIDAEVIRATEAEAGLTPLNPENETAYVRRGASWIDVNEVITGVNADFVDVDLGIESHITNDVNGVVVESTLPMKVPTSGAEEMTVDNEKNVLNREYLHNNISLGRATENTSELTDIKYSKLGINISKDYIIPTLSSSSSSDNNLTQSPISRQDILYTKDYTVYLARGGTGGDVPMLAFIDKQGTLSYTAEPFYQNDWATDVSLNRKSIVLAGFHQEFVRDNPQYANHFYIFSNISGLIGLYDGKVFKGVLNKDTPIKIPNITGTIGSSKAIKSLGLKKHPVIGLVAEKDPLGIMIGVNDDGDFDLMNYRTIQTNNGPTNNVIGSAYVGNNNIWCIQYASNLVTKINYLGETTAEVLTDTSNVALTATAFQPCIDGGYETNDGDVCFLVRAGASAAVWTTYIVYCDDKEDAPAGEVVKAYKTSKSYLNNNEPLGNKAFFETQNHIFYSPTYYVNLTSGGSITWGGRTINATYEVFNKETKTLTVRTYPWSSVTAGNEVNSWMQRSKTENGYWWIFPTWAESPYAVVIDPVTGASKTVDLGTGTTTKWCSNSVLTYSSTYYISGGGDNIGVTSKGIGIAIDVTGKKVLLFKGDGEFAVYDYTSDPGNAIFPRSATLYDVKGFKRTIAFENGFLCGYENAYNGNVFTYVSLNKENPLAEPTYLRHTWDGTSLDLRLGSYNLLVEQRDVYSNDFEKIFMVRDPKEYILPPCWRDSQSAPNYAVFGLASRFKEIDVTNDASDTIFLKDGDYVISEA